MKANGVKILEVGEDYALSSSADLYVSFGMGWTLDPGLDMDLDLSCLMLTARGTIKDVVFYGCMESKHGAVRHLGDDTAGDGSEDHEDEEISIYLKELPEDIAVLVFLLSGSNACDLSRVKGVFGRLRGEGRVPQVEIPVPDQMLNNGPRSILLAALYQTEDEASWSMRNLLQTFDEPSWGELIPEIKGALKPLIPGVKIDPAEMVAVLPKSEDRPLDEIANFRRMKNGLEPNYRVQHITLQVGWTLVDSTEEKVDLDTNILLADDKGSIVGKVNYDNLEEMGVKLLGDVTDGIDTEEAEETALARFPALESATVALNEVDSSVRSIILLLTNYTGQGFTPLEKIRCRITDTNTGHDLSVFSVDCRLGADHGKTAVVICKLYREPISSGFHEWRLLQQNSTVPSMEALRKMHVQRVLPAIDEDAEDIETWERNNELQWRVRAVGTFCFAQGVEDAEPVANAIAAYDGAYDEDGKRHDRRARCTYSNSDCYCGTYTHGVREGLGIYLFHYGSSFHGTFRDGKMCEGTMWNPDGGIYVGQFCSNQKEGRGTYTYPGGDQFIGQWVAGLKEGKGTYKYADGTLLSGTWKAGEPHGNLKYEESTTYNSDGTFQQGIPNGPWTFRSLKTGLQQKGQYKYTPVAADTAGTAAKPMPPHYKGLSWENKGKPHFTDPLNRPRTAQPRLISTKTELPKEPIRPSTAKPIHFTGQVEARPSTRRRNPS